MIAQAAACNGPYRACGCRIEKDRRQQSRPAHDRSKGRPANAPASGPGSGKQPTTKTAMTIKMATASKLAESKVRQTANSGKRKPAPRRRTNGDPEDREGRANSTTPAAVVTVANVEAKRQLRMRERDRA